MLLLTLLVIYFILRNNYAYRIKMTWTSVVTATQIYMIHHNKELKHTPNYYFDLMSSFCLIAFTPWWRHIHHEIFIKISIDQEATKEILNNYNDYVKNWFLQNCKHYNIKEEFLL